MSRRLIRWVALLQVGLTVLTGCSPTRPFYNRNNPSLANYLDQAMSIEYADVEHTSLPEATQTFEPFSHENMPTKFHDWSLEDCISMGLQNSKMLNSTPGSNTQSGSMAASYLSAQPGQIPSVYDPALVALTGNTQPLTIDSQGNRVSQRGSVRANQVGGVEQALSEFDAQYSTIFGFNTTDRPRNVGQGNVFNPQLFKATDATLQNALSKRLATGTVVTARANTVYSKNNVPASGNAIGSTNFGRAVPSDYTASLEMQISQPLMRGRGTLVNRIPVALSRINEDIAVHQFEANVRNLLRDIEHSYWDLYLGYRAVETAIVARDRALELWRAVKLKSEESGPTFNQAAGRLAQFEAQLHIAINGSNVPGNDPLGLVGRERVLREKLGLAPNDGLFIRPSDMPSEARVSFEWDNVKMEALTRNTEVRIAKWAIKQRELEHMSAKNQLLPQLDLVGTYRWLGVGDNLIAAHRTGLAFPNPGSYAVENLLNGDFQEVGARIEFTPTPLGARREKANIGATQMGLKKSHEELKLKELALQTMISSVWSSMTSGYTSAIDFARQSKENKAELAKYEIQLETAEDLSQLLDLMLRAEEQLARAQLQYYQSIVEYNKSIVNIHYLKGSLFDLNNVTLGEGAWVEKAYWDAERRAEERAGGIYFDYGYTRPGVVSQGPVESGGTTEGNISDMSPRVKSSQPEEVEAKEADDSKESILDKEKNDKKNSDEVKSTSRMREGQRPITLRPSAGQNAGVKPASSEAPIVRADQFQWGNLGIDDQAGMRPATSNNLRQVPASTGSTNSEVRQDSPNAPVLKGPNQSSNTSNQGTQIPWRSRN